MTAAALLAQRRSIRAFDTRAVEPAVIDRVLAAALEAPSWNNTQPYRVAVATGTVRDALARDLTARFDRASDLLAMTPARRWLSALVGGGRPDGDFALPRRYPPHLQARREATGFGLYETLGIARQDRAARNAQMRRNFDFFGAPVGLFVFVDKALGSFAALDAGAFLQSLLLAALDEGLGSCAQGALATWAGPVKARFAVPAGHALICGIALGYPADAPVNRFRPRRLPVADLVLPAR